MDLKEILTQMFNDRFHYLTEHECDYIEAMYKKIVYSRRAPEGNDEVNIRRIFKIYLTRKMK